MQSLMIVAIATARTPLGGEPHRAVSQTAGEKRRQSEGLAIRETALFLRGVHSERE